MKDLETGKDKLKKICDLLRKETLEPAENEKEEILLAARQEAEEVVADAKNLAKKMIDDAKIEIEKQKESFRAALKAASRQAVEALKEKLEKNLFNPQLSTLVAKSLADPSVIAKVIEAIIKALEKEGTEGDLSAYVAGSILPRTVNELLASKVLEKLKEKSVVIGAFNAGVEIKLLKDQITLAVTGEVVQEMILSYIRKDFKEYIFGG
jgi:V/A-type H+/Na+-transporting ATPase subunit E